jgi:hypothetical protein
MLTASLEVDFLELRWVRIEREENRPWWIIVREDAELVSACMRDIDTPHARGGPHAHALLFERARVKVLSTAAQIDPFEIRCIQERLDGSDLAACLEIQTAKAREIGEWLEV